MKKDNLLNFSPSGFSNLEEKDYLNQSSLNSVYSAIKNEIKFIPSDPLTLGVEIEIQLIDQNTLNLTSRAEALLQVSKFIHKIKPEFYLSTIEVNTDKCETVEEVEKDLLQTFNELENIAKELGLWLSTTGSHPFAKYIDCIISPQKRYQELIEKNQWLTRRMTVFGLHVHLGMPNGDDCIRYNNFFLNFLPHLLALSASSPFWQGTDTGLSSYRPTTYEALPTAGQPYQVQSWKEFENLYASLKNCGSIQSIKDLWWDIRPSPGFGTLEIRVCDGCATLYETLAITAFIHMLAYWFLENNTHVSSMLNYPRWLLRENKWRAMRYGLDAELVTHISGKTKSLREDLFEWLEKLKPYAKNLNYQKYFDSLIKLLSLGTSSERQRKIYNTTKSLEEVVLFSVNEFFQQQPIWV